MRVCLDLPAWVDERNVRIFAGIELVARCHKDGKWEIKVERCNQCGKCCMNLGQDHPFPIIDGQCSYLAKEVGNNPHWLCSLSVNRPFGCSACTPVADYCPIRLEAI